MSRAGIAASGAASSRGFATIIAALVALGCGGAGATPGASSPGPVATTVGAAAPARSPSTEATGCRGLEPGDSEVTLRVGDATRTALVHVPAPIASSAKRVPVLIAFHGYGSGAAEFAAYSGLPRAADAAGFVVVFPQGLGTVPEWHFGNPSVVAGGEAADEAMFEALLARLDAAGCVDMGRAFLAGHSQGGGMASHLACLHADRVAGAAIVSGMLLAPPCRPARAVPILQFHAVDDPVLPYSGGTVQGAPAGFPPVLAAEVTASAWAARDGCTGAPAEESLSAGVVRRTWSQCLAPVTFYRLAAGGHGWPAMDRGTGIDAAGVIARFVTGQPQD